MLQIFEINEGTDGNGDVYELYTAILINVLPAVRNRVDMMTLPMVNFLAGYPTAGNSGLQLSNPRVYGRPKVHDVAALSADIRSRGPMVRCKRSNAGAIGPSNLTDTHDYSADKADFRASGLLMKYDGSRQRYGRVQESGGIALFVAGTALDCLPAASSASNRMLNEFLPTTAKRRTEARCIALVTGVLPQLTRTILTICHSRHNRRLVGKRSSRLDPAKD
ncbi:hypothetical protein An07g03180 [Aspergillus niger]|uniref:Uncharacterized protein n=2 Tax=Aspergillus niger TaxID=5061 RepID=A2QMS8_ASPNC|nr:hypothetical protein An07g03180 [Aspergillus niger]CAL00252.1 hypothetical protein An07g03180 [Aspergillus niger]